MVRNLRSSFLASLRYIIQYFKYSHQAVLKIPRIYSSYNWKFIPIDQHLPIFPTLPNPWQTPFSSVSEFRSFRFHIKVRAQSIYFFCLTYFTQHNAFKVHPSCNKLQDFFLRLNHTPLVVVVVVCVCLSTYLSSDTQLPFHGLTFVNSWPQFYTQK